MTRWTATAAAAALTLVPFAPSQAQGVIVRREISLDLAQELANAALAACRERGYKVTITVLDQAGGPLVVLHDNAAGLHTIENSRRKAYTARTFGVSSAEFAKRYAANPAAVQQVVLANIVAAAGALPIKAGADVVGAVGVSGSPGGDNDERCAQIGIDKIADRLN